MHAAVAAIFQKMDTSMGLSSIATLSLGLSMSMAGAGRAVMRSLGPGHQQALQQFFPILPNVLQAERMRMRTNHLSEVGASCSNPSARRTPRSSPSKSPSNDRTDGRKPVTLTTVQTTRDGLQVVQSLDHTTQVNDSKRIAVGRGVIKLADGGSKPNSKTY